MHLLRHYEALLSLSQTMAGLAEAQAWESLVQTELARRELFAQIPAAALPSLPADEQKRVAAIIQQIQAFDKSVNDYVLPWRDSVSALLVSLQPKQNSAA